LKETFDSSTLFIVWWIRWWWWNIFWNNQIWLYHWLMSYHCLMSGSVMFEKKHFNLYTTKTIIFYKEQ